MSVPTDLKSNLSSLCLSTATAGQADRSEHRLSLERRERYVRKESSALVSASAAAHWHRHRQPAAHGHAALGS